MNIDELPNCEVLREAVSSRTVKLPDGTSKALVANVSITHSRTLHAVVLENRVQRMVEIGMAQGVSTLSILTALQQTGGRLTSVDPYYDWKSARMAALYAVDRAGFGQMHRHIEAPSYVGLPAILDQGESIDMVYIDGAHDFDNVFIDAFYSDKLLKTGGIIGFNDAGWREVWRVIRWLLRTGRYVELDVGLKPSYTGRNMFVTLGRMVLRWPRQDRYFRKLKDAALT